MFFVLTVGNLVIKRYAKEPDFAVRDKVWLGSKKHSV